MNSVSDQTEKRRYPIGAEIVSGQVYFRVWSPLSNTVEAVFEDTPDGNNKNDISNTASLKLLREEGGYFSGILPSVPETLLYGFRLDNSDKILPDPVSRFQPYGPKGFSQLVDPCKFKWTDHNWTGISDENCVIYEMHTGTFTRDGLWEAAQDFLEELAGIGINVLELMPVCEFYGDFGWGYDGVNLFAPSHLYGTPDHFRSFVNKAHNVGIGVILDVVYNHLGPGCDFMKRFSPFYFTEKYKNEWGEAINFDGPGSDSVREYFITNAQYWIEEFHIDGYRIDATQQIFDNSDYNIIHEISDSVKNVSKDRKTYLIGENENQNVGLINRFGLNALWNDDFHHSAVVALNGHSQAYYSDYRGSPQEFVSAAKYGFLYQGQYYFWQQKTRGTPTFGMPANCFIHYLQNHDQVANTCRGLRLHELSAGSLYRAFTALLILGPQVPLIFAGQEFCASSPFYYFADREVDGVQRAKAGRKKFLSQFPGISFVDGPLVPHPSSKKAFFASKINQNERKLHKEMYKLHRDLLKIRHKEPIFKKSGRKGIDGAVIGEYGFVLRYFGLSGDQDRLLIVNMGQDRELRPNPQPLLAPPRNYCWNLEWYSENPDYGGEGIPPVVVGQKWVLSGRTAYFLNLYQTN